MGADPGGRDLPRVLRPLDGAGARGLQHRQHQQQGRPGLDEPEAAAGPCPQPVGQPAQRGGLVRQEVIVRVTIGPPIDPGLVPVAMGDELGRLTDEAMSRDDAKHLRGYADAAFYAGFA